jgi:hypothetical protein
MFGDIIAILIGFRPVPNLPGGQGIAIGAAIPAAYSAVKVAENESPLPQDRVFVTYNYYNNVNSIVDFHRETIGFEKSFFDGTSSLGIRLPFFQVDDEGPNRQSKIDDVSVILKYALIRDRDAGNVLSAGVSITMPSGAAYRTTTGDELAITFVQPFVGYVRNQENWYVHGFMSLVVPTDEVAPKILFNDLGLGYWVYRGNGQGIVTGVVPTFEVHANTPLSHRGSSDPERRRVSVDLTAGSHVVFNHASSLGLAVGTPVTGPRLFSVEALVQLDLAF